MVSTVFYDKLENVMYDVTTKAVRSDGTDDPFGKVYYIADVVYQSGNEDAKNTDQISSFLLGSDHVLYIPDATSSSGYSPAGKFEEFKFAPATFDEYFKDKTGWQNFPHSAEWIREHKLTAYKLENEGTFYYLITTENGGIYLTCGNSADAYPEIDENAYMHYAVSLSQTGEVTNAIISEGAYIYVAPHVSTTVEDLPPYIFTMNDDSFYLERDGDIIAGNSPFEWQEFPWTEEEWENMFMIDCPASMRSLKEKYADVGYMPLSGRYFILKVASQIWVADKPDKLISTVFVAKEYASASLAFSPGASAYQFTRYITAGDINNTQINFHYEPSMSVSGSLTRKELDSLIKVLNEIDERYVTEGTGRYDAWLSLFSANREIILRYDKELRRISFGFDTETSALYGDRQWMTEDEDLCRWFDEQIEKNGEDLAFINADSPYHTMKNLWKDFATTKTLTQKDNEGNRISTRDLTEAEYSKLFNIITYLPKESYEKGEMSSEYIAELRHGFEHAFYFGYTPGEDRILLSGEWETMQLFGGTDWIISSDEFVKYFEKLVK